MKNIKVSKRLVVLLFLCFILIFLVIFLFFISPSYRSKLSVVDTALGLRSAIMNLSLTSRQSLDDYESLVSANNIYSYNTCTRLRKVEFDRGWARDWLYLLMGDAIYADVSGELEYYDKLSPMLQDLYTYDSADVMYDYHGLESYCVPYLLLEEMKKNSDTFLYDKSYERTKEVCLAFYDIEGRALDEASICDFDDNTCISDEVLYEKIDMLLSQDVMEIGGLEFDLVPESQRWLAPIDIVGDHVVFSYAMEEQDYVENINYILLRSVYNFIYYDYVLREEEQTQVACDFIPDYHLGLLKAFEIKGRYLDDSDILAKNEEIFNKLLAYCFESNKGFETTLFGDSNIGRQLEFYYLMKDRFEEYDIKNHVNEFLEANTVFHPYGRKNYLFFDSEFGNAEKKDCRNVRLDFGLGAKQYFYLLLHSINEN
jgi:hypothetical protein